MRTSSHLAHVQIPQSERTLLWHTLRGAVDIVPEEVALAVKNFDDASDALNEAEIKTLKLRGYLTDSTPEQELEQAHAVMRLAAKNFHSMVELTFQFPRGETGDMPCAFDDEAIEGGFSLAAALAGDEGMVAVHFEIPSSDFDTTITKPLLQSALGHGCTIMPTATISNLGALGELNRSEYFNHIALTTDGSNKLSEFEGLAAQIVNLFEHQIHVSWTCKTDGMSTEQLKAVLGVREQVRQKYSNFVVYLFADQHEGTGAAGVLDIDGTEAPFISSENEDILGTLLRFVLMPGIINYRPFFQPQVKKLFVDSATRQLTYKDGTNLTFVGNLEEVRARVEEEIRQTRDPLDIWKSAQGASECLSCKYSLVCGRDWIARDGFLNAQHCAHSFEQRLEQTLPLLLFVLRGSWRPPAASKTQVDIA